MRGFDVRYIDSCVIHDTTLTLHYKFLVLPSSSQGISSKVLTVIGNHYKSSFNILTSMAPGLILKSKLSKYS